MQTQISKSPVIINYLTASTPSAKLDSLLFKTLACWDGPSTATLEPAFSESLGGPVYRLCIGELIPETERSIFTPKLLSAEHKNPVFSGSIGFADFTFNSKQDSLEVLVIGIEPHAQQFGFGIKSLQALENLAIQLGMKSIRACDVQNPHAHNMLVRMGYQISGRMDQLYLKPLHLC